MNKLFDHLNTETRHIRLSDTEKRSMRAALERAMGEAARRSSAGTIPSPFIFLAMRTLSAALVVVFVFGGTAYAAEGAVPGELLYPVKTAVNERVRETLAVSDESRAAWHAEVVERRAEEAEVLVARGTLSEPVKEELAVAIETHAEHAEEFATRVRESDEDRGEKLAVRLSFALEAHSIVLARLGEEDGDDENYRQSEDLSRRIASRIGAGRNERAALQDTAPTMTMTATPIPEAAPVAATLSVSAVQDSAAVQAAEDMAVSVESIEHAAKADRREDRFDFKADVEEVLERAEERLDALRVNISAEALRNAEEQIRAMRRSVRENGSTRELLREATLLDAFLRAQSRVERPLLPPPVEMRLEWKDGEERRDDADPDGEYPTDLREDIRIESRLD